MPAMEEMEQPPPVGIEKELRDYLADSRTWDVGVRAAVPLFAIYELGLLFLPPPPARNAADAFLRDSIGGFEPRMMATLNALVLAAFLVAALVRSARAPEVRVFSLMFVESLLWSLMLVPSVFFLEDVARLMIAVPADGVLADVVFGIGAGVWEELLFRAIPIGLGIWLLRMTGLSPVAGQAFLIVATALFFSWAHHAGQPGGIDDLGVFVFRFLAGVFLGVLFVFRGFGVACWTHAAYDVLLALDAID